MKRKQQQTLYTYASGIQDAIDQLVIQSNNYGDLASINDLIAILRNRKEVIENLDDINYFDGWIRAAGGRGIL